MLWLCQEYHSEGYESKAEDVSIVEPDILLTKAPKVSAMLNVLLEV